MTKHDRRTVLGMIAGLFCRIPFPVFGAVVDKRIFKGTYYWRASTPDPWFTRMFDGDGVEHFPYATMINTETGWGLTYPVGSDGKRTGELNAAEDDFVQEEFWVKPPVTLTYGDNPFQENGLK